MVNSQVLPQLIEANFSNAPPCKIQIDTLQLGKKEMIKTIYLKMLDKIDAFLANTGKLPFNVMPDIDKISEVLELPMTKLNLGNMLTGEKDKDKEVKEKISVVGVGKGNNPNNKIPGLRNKKDKGVVPENEKDTKSKRITRSVAQNKVAKFTELEEIVSKQRDSLIRRFNEGQETPRIVIQKNFKEILYKFLENCYYINSEGKRNDIPHNHLEVINSAAEIIFSTHIEKIKHLWNLKNSLDDPVENFEFYFNEDFYEDLFSQVNFIITLNN